MVLLCDSTRIVTFSVGSVKTTYTLNSSHKKYTVTLCTGFSQSKSTQFYHQAGEGVHMCWSFYRRTEVNHTLHIFANPSKCKEALWYNNSFFFSPKYPITETGMTTTMSKAYKKKKTTLISMNSFTAWFHYEGLTCPLWSLLFGGLQQSEKQQRLSMPCVSIR